MAHAQDVPYTIGHWEADSLGNHRVVVQAPAPAEAIRVHIPWRRRDHNPEAKELVIVTAATGAKINNVARININRAFGDLAFQAEKAGIYHVYYLPYHLTGTYYPKATYPEPTSTADAAWLQTHHLTPEQLSDEVWKTLPQAEVKEIQSVDALNSFFPMEIIATPAEMETLRAMHPEPYLLFPEDRKYPIRMTHDLPYQWIEKGVTNAFHGEADRGEFYAFQIGVYAAHQPIEDLEVVFGDLTHTEGAGTFPASALRCFNLGGTDWTGKAFSKTVPVEQGKIQALWFGIQIPETTTSGTYEGQITVLPKGMEGTTVKVHLTISNQVLTDAGDSEPWRHSRLRWLDSEIALNDDLVAPFTPVEAEEQEVRVLGRHLTLGTLGLPTQIQSYFAPEMTHLQDTPRNILASPVTFTIEDAIGQAMPWKAGGVQFTKHNEGTVAWETQNKAGPLTMTLDAKLDFDGTIEYEMVLKANETTTLNDIRLEIPMAGDVARYMLGMGRKGGFRPDTLAWAWKIEHNQDGAWIGDVNAGLQFSLRDNQYERPLNTNFYLSKPLIMPASWYNAGKGGCDLRNEGQVYLVRCYSGTRTMEAGEVQHYNFRLVVTPFKPIDTKAQWNTRFYHRFEPLSKIDSIGANTVNVHHANRVNPYINYPFLSVNEMKAYVEEGHQRGMKIKIYYTVRELANRAPELFALRSLGDEILSDGPGGGYAWLQEHLEENYIAGWFVPDLKDAAIVNSGVSRWHNYYLEGLNWLVQNISIDGLYIDDVAFDRTVMKRLRKILDRGRPGALIDLHSANQFNPRDGFVNSAHLYMEHFPYINRLWFGEYFDYDAPPEYWMTEVAGIPFGLMGEMLQDGGNRWRGMLYGMTSRAPWSGDPTPLWKLWDDFAMEETQMIGYWVPHTPVKTGRPDIWATSYVQDGKTLVSIASWAKDSVQVHLDIDWEALGLDPETTQITAPAIRDFQEEMHWVPADSIPVAPGRGWLLILSE